MLRKPTALKPGDRVRLVAPASPFDRKLFAAGLKALRMLDLEPVVAPAEFVREGFLAGGDGDRAERLEQALLEKDTQAIWCIRGGYGTARLLPWLDLGALRRRPKLLIGFSDVTALLVQLARPGGFVAVHGPVITQLAGLPIGDRRWLRTLLFTPRTLGRIPLGRSRTVVAGEAEGRLAAGNLSILASLAGTPFAPDLAGTILCLEEVGEEAYRLDRLFWQIFQSGMLQDVRGLVLGELTGCKPGGSGRHSARWVMEQAARSLSLPALSGASFGHGRRNVALPVGVRARLDTRTGTVTLLEPAVR